MKYKTNFVNKLLLWGGGICLLFTGAGCGVFTPETDAISAESAVVVPMPTVAGFFQEEQEIELSSPLAVSPSAETDLMDDSLTAPTEDSPIVQDAPTPEAPRSAAAPQTEAITTDQSSARLIATADDIIFTEVYGDEINEDWMLWPDTSMVITATTAVAHSGRSSIAITPKADFSTLFFVVNSDTSETYPRNEVLGVSVWLNSGENTVELDDLALTVIGSNAYSYWVSGDHSVSINENSFFSETRLYYLGLNRAIPPNTWVELQVWLDDLLYDPDYEYVTGIYLKNDEGFRGTIYIDDVSIIRITDKLVTEPVVAAEDEDEAVTDSAAAIDADSSRSSEEEAVASAERECGVPPEGWVPYIVQSGDTLSELVGSRKVIEEVMTVNCMEDTRIYTLRELWIPGASPTATDSESVDEEETAAADNDDISAETASEDDTSASAADSTATVAPIPSSAVGSSTITATTTTIQTTGYPSVPVYYISSPGQNALVSGTTPILGTASFDPALVQFYKVELGIPQLSNDVQWLTVGETHVMPVVNGHLETLFAAGLPPGDYYIRLILVQDSNYVGEPYTVKIRR